MVVRQLQFMAVTAAVDGNQSRDYNTTMEALSWTNLHVDPPFDVGLSPQQKGVANTVAVAFREQVSISC